MSEDGEYKITRTETWELLRVKNRGAEVLSKDEWCYSSYAYILLYKNRKTDARFEDELLVTIIPLFEINRYGKVELYDGRSTWSVHANMMTQQIKFAKYSSFQIPDYRLKGRGLGSYILSDLVQWVKQYHPTFAIEKLSVVGFLDNLSGASERRERLYEGVGFRMEFNTDTLAENRSGKAVAENSSVLHENRNPKKVKSISLKELVKIIEENCTLHQDKHNLMQKLEQLKYKIGFWKATSILFFLTTMVIGFAFITKS